MPRLKTDINEGQLRAIITENRKEIGSVLLSFGFNHEVLQRGANDTLIHTKGVIRDRVDVDATGERKLVQYELETAQDWRPLFDEMAYDSLERMRCGHPEKDFRENANAFLLDADYDNIHIWMANLDLWLKEQKAKNVVQPARKAKPSTE